MSVTSQCNKTLQIAQVSGLNAFFGDQYNVRYDSWQEVRKERQIAEQTEEAGQGIKNKSYTTFARNEGLTRENPIIFSDPFTMCCVFLFFSQCRTFHREFFMAYNRLTWSKSSGLFLPAINHLSILQPFVQPVFILPVTVTWGGSLNQHLQVDYSFSLKIYNKH